MARMRMRRKTTLECELGVSRRLHGFPKLMESLLCFGLRVVM